MLVRPRSTAISAPFSSNSSSTSSMRPVAHSPGGEIQGTHTGSQQGSGLGSTGRFMTSS